MNRAAGSGPRRRRSRAAVSALLAALAAVLLAELSLPASALAGTASAAPEQAASGTSTPLTLTLTRVSPAALTPDTPLEVQGTVRNTSGAQIKSATVRLRLHTVTLTTRTVIDDWQKGEPSGSADTLLPGTAKLHALGPGETQSFTVTVAKGRTGLSTLSSFGPRGITVEAVSSAKTGSTTLGQLPTTVVWSPPSTRPTKTQLSLLVPFTASDPSENAGAPAPAVGESFQSGGRMDQLLQAASDPGISWALDPAVLESAQRLAATGEVSSADDDPLSTTPSPSSSTSSQDDGTSSDSTAAKDAAAGWLATLKRQRGSRSAFALPYADPDLTSLFRSTKGLGLLRAADQLGKAATKAALGSALDTTIAWPGDGQVTPAGVTALARAGRTAIVLPASAQPPTTVTSTTPTGRSTVHDDGADLAGLLDDDQLSDLFAESGTPGTAGGASGPAVATQTMLAQLAAISIQLPDTRQVLAVAPRDWRPDPDTVQALLDDLHAAPWVSLKGVGDLRATTSTTPRGEPKYHKQATKSELPIGNVSGATAMIRDLDTLAPTLSDPDAVVGPLQEQVVSLLSLSWRSKKEGLSGARSDVRADVEKLVGGIRLLVGEKTKTLAAHSASIPVVVSNSTQFPMQVLVQLVPGSGQLAIPGKVLVHAAAQSRTQVLVPARAIANGNVKVEGRLLTPKGKQLGSTGTFTLRARPDWETGGTIAAGVILGLLLILGLLRGIGRGRTRIPPQSVPDVDDQATDRMPPEPEQVSEPVDVSPEPDDSGTFGEDGADPDERDLADSQESRRRITRAEKRSRAASETRPAPAPAGSGPGDGTAPDAALRRPAISRETR